MIKNVGKIDRYFRVTLGLILIAAPLMNKPEIWANSIVAYAAIAIGLILNATAVVGFCPIYSLFGKSRSKS